MSRILDLNDCYTKEEVVIYKSTTSLFIRIIFIILSIVFTAFAFSQQNGGFSILFTLVCGAVSFFTIYKTKIYYDELNEIQLRISTKGVQYLEEDIVPWNAIENERIEEIEDGESVIYYFVYYCKNCDRAIRLDLEELSISGKVLISIFKIFRTRSVV